MRNRFTRLAAAATLIACVPAAPAAQPTAPPNAAITITAEKMCCQGCARKVSGKLYTVKGVKSVSVDLPTHTVTVSLPQQDIATVGALCDAVRQGVDGPATVTTAAAAYKLAPAESDDQAAELKKMGGTQRVVIDNLHCQGCARKIASRLYTIKGVTKVEVDMAHETLTVRTHAKAEISPWQTAAAVAQAGERPIAVTGAFGRLTIEYAEAAAPKDHQAQNPVSGGIQR